MKIRSTVLWLAGLAGVMFAPTPAAADVTVTVSLPRLVMVVGTEVRYCDDCNEDVFFFGNVWYVYRSGGWYRRAAWGDSWMQVRLGSLPDAFMRVPPGRFKHRYGNRAWHPGRQHHPKLDTWNGRSSGRWEPRRESVRTAERQPKTARETDRRRGGENTRPSPGHNEKADEKDGKKKHDKGSKGGRGNR